MKSSGSSEVVVRVADEEPVLFEQRSDTCADGLEQPSELGGCRPRCVVKLQPRHRYDYCGTLSRWLY